MAIPGGQDGEAAQDTGKAGFGGARAAEAPGRLKADETLVSMNELNIGSAIGNAGGGPSEETTGPDEMPAGSDYGSGNPGTRFSVPGDGNIVNEPSSLGFSPDRASVISAPAPAASDVEEPGYADTAKAPIAGHVTCQRETEETAMPLSDSIVDLALLDDRPPHSGADAEPPLTLEKDAWMEIVESRPGLSYHQAEILLQVALMTPATMGQAIERCVYLLARMKRLGPGVLKKSVAIGG